MNQNFKKVIAILINCEQLPELMVSLHADGVGLQKVSQQTQHFTCSCSLLCCYLLMWFFCTELKRKFLASSLLQACVVSSSG